MLLLSYNNFNKFVHIPLFSLLLSYVPSHVDINTNPNPTPKKTHLLLLRIKPLIPSNALQQRRHSLKNVKTTRSAILPLDHHAPRQDHLKSDITNTTINYFDYHCCERFGISWRVSGKLSIG